MKPFISVIIVTHDNESVIHKAMQSLKEQTRKADEILLIDSGSKTMDYLTPYQNIAKVIKGGDEIGFCRANNIGMQHISAQTDYVFLMNPDAFPQPDFLAIALTTMENPVHQQTGAITGITLGYSLKNNTPSGTYDSTGVFQTWYGRWYDRSQGQPVDPTLYQTEESIPAICGAVFFARKKALDSVKFPEGEIFDPTFFMYKEDIDLSLRLRKKKWDLRFIPDLKCYHCRGWNPERHNMPRIMRLSSARNEWRIHLREKRAFPLLYSALKLLLVKVGNK